jgi:hypothetical protein
VILRGFAEEKKNQVKANKKFIEYFEDNIEHSPSGFFPEPLVTMNDVEAAM